MSTSTAFAAQILETSASAYAGVAASLLLERQPEVAERYAPLALSVWKAHLHQRILELSAALGAEEPQIFCSHIRWEEESLRARDLDETDLQAGLSCLCEVLAEELPEQARGAATSYLEAALGIFEEAPQTEARLDSANPLERRALQYLEAALEGNAGQAIDLVVGAVGTEGLELRQAYEVLFLAQREVGKMWHLGELEVAEEHLVTATAERATASLVRLAPRKPSNGKTVIIAAVAGNRHGLAVRVLADFFEIAGWRSICLGTDVPPDDLATSAVYFAADLLALSVALPTQLKTARQTIQAVRSLPGRNIKLMIGGGAFANAPELWQKLGADGFIQGVDEAVDLGWQLVESAS